MCPIQERGLQWLGVVVAIRQKKGGGAGIRNYRLVQRCKCMHVAQIVIPQGGGSATPPCPFAKVTRTKSKGIDILFQYFASILFLFLFTFYLSITVCVSQYDTTKHCQLA